MSRLGCHTQVRPHLLASLVVISLSIAQLRVFTNISPKTRMLIVNNPNNPAENFILVTNY